MNLRVTIPLAALLAAGCSPSFTGPEKVDGLRVLAVQADPPEIGVSADAQGDAAWPAATTAIRTLVGHPAFQRDGEVHAVVLHLACTPDPADPNGTVCTKISALSNPTQLNVTVDAAGVCSGTPTGKKDAITVTGVEACSRTGCGPLSLANPADAGSVVTMPTPRYRIPDEASLLGALGAGDPRRVLGTDVIDVAVTLEGDATDLVPTDPVGTWDCEHLVGPVLARVEALWTARPHVLSLKWIHVRGPEMPKESAPNLNPQVDAITLGGTNLLPLPASNPVPAGRDQGLKPYVPQFETLRQTYQRFDTDGKLLETRKEDWSYSWFATDGSLEEIHTTTPDDENTFSLGDGRAMLWVVVRDLRGGEAWTSAEVVASP